MIRSLFTAATGMNAQQNKIDVVSNNLANINTTGFKKMRVDFQDLMYTMLVEPGTATSTSSNHPTGIQVGHGVRTTGTSRVDSQGDLTATNNQLDIAIEGQGFLEVQLPDGSSAYTRTGALQLDENGQLVTTDGFVLQPAITIPVDAISISIGQDGTVSVTQPGSTTPSQVGQLQLNRFQNSRGLKNLGQNLLAETQASGSPTTGNPAESGFGRVTQGFLESSNVQVVEEVVQMILAQRAYESASKSIETADQMLNGAINLKR